MKKIVRIADTIFLVASYSAGLCLIGIMILTMVEVITRYILHHPLILCDEFGGYSLIAISFLGLAYCWKERGHIRIDLLTSRLSAKLSNRLRIFKLIVAVLYVALAAKVSWAFLFASFQRQMKSNTWLMTPLHWPQLVIPIGFSILLLALIVEILTTLHGIKVGATSEQESKEL